MVNNVNLVSFFIKRFSKKLTLGLSSCGGRNFKGRISVAHRGGGNKKKYRAVDRFRRLNQGGCVIKLFKFPALSAFLGVVVYDNGLSSFVLLSSEVKVGFRIFSGEVLSPKESFLTGSSLTLKDINLFSLINSIEKIPLAGASIVRAAGSSAFITSREKNNKV
jgi:large subunit ribosomal protein L2